MSRVTRVEYVADSEIRRLEKFSDVRIHESNRPSSWDEAPPPDAEADRAFAEFARGLDGLIVCHGAPRVTASVLAESPNLAIVGELEGDRFAHRIDLAAAAARRVRVVDTTHASSLGVAEWALALAIIGLRNGGDLFRRLVTGEVVRLDPEQGGYDVSYGSELTGKIVSLIGCGFIGRRLLALLAPFRVVAYVYDPYAPRELADAYEATFTTLDRALQVGRVVFCLAPLTPRTRGMIGARELGLLQEGTVFVNVSRGAIVDTNALLESLALGRIVACLDVFDPEPIPADSPIRGFRNVFLSPHIAGVTRETGPRFFSMMVEEFERFFAGDEPRAELNPRVIANRLGLMPDGIEWRAQDSALPRQST